MLRWDVRLPKRVFYTPDSRSRLTRIRSTGGFSFIELIVALAIMVMIAAVVTPALVSTLDAARVETSQETLGNLQQALLDFENDTNHFPGRLSHLTTPVTGSDQNSCGVNYPTFPPPSNVTTLWDGPYTTPAVPLTGLPVAIGTVQNQLQRIPASGNPAVLRINVTPVTFEDATRLNNNVDGDGVGNAGTVQWTGPDAQGLVTLHYVLNVNQC